MKISSVLAILFILTLASVSQLKAQSVIDQLKPSDLTPEQLYKTTDGCKVPVLAATAPERLKWQVWSAWVATNLYAVSPSQQRANMICKRIGFDHAKKNFEMRELLGSEVKAYDLTKDAVVELKDRGQTCFIPSIQQLVSSDIEDKDAPSASTQFIKKYGAKPDVLCTPEVVAEAASLKIASADGKNLKSMGVISHGSVFVHIVCE